MVFLVDGRWMDGLKGIRTGIAKDHTVVRTVCLEPMPTLVINMGSWLFGQRCKLMSRVRSDGFSAQFLRDPDKDRNQGRRKPKKVNDVTGVQQSEP